MPPNTTGGGKGKRNYQQYSNNYYQGAKNYGSKNKGNKGKTNWGNKGTGKGNKGNKGKGAKGAPGDTSNSAWAGRMNYTAASARYQNGQSCCRKHHLHNNCPGGCSRSHNVCPNKLQDGSYCKGNHPAFRCPTGHTE